MSVVENRLASNISSVSKDNKDTLHRPPNHEEQIGDVAIKSTLAILGTVCAVLPIKGTLAGPHGVVITRSSDLLKTSEWNRGKVTMQETYATADLSDLTRQTVWYKNKNGRTYELSKDRIDGQWIYSYKEDGLQQPNKDFLPQAQAIISMFLKDK